jgi:hypothetical protein
MKHLCKYCGKKFTGKPDREFCSINCHLSFEREGRPEIKHKKITKSASLDPRDVTFLKSNNLSVTDAARIGIKKLRYEKKNKEIYQEFKPLFNFCFFSILLFLVSTLTVTEIQLQICFIGLLILILGLIIQFGYIFLKPIIDRITNIINS